MKCPVCKTECSELNACPECGFTDLTPTFLSESEGNAWLENVVWPWRHKYWNSLTDFEFDGTTLVKYSGNAQNVSIPYGVQKLGEKCMFCNSSVRFIAIPNSVSVIEDRAFSACMNLCEVNIPSSVSRIGENAFSTCVELKQIKLPSSLKTLSRQMLTGCAFQDLIIPEGVETIEDRAVYSGNLLSLHIPSSVKTIGEEIASPKDLESITVAVGNPYFKVEYGCLIDIREQRILLATAGAGIPQVALKQIGAGVFSFRDMTEVDVPEGITHIGRQAFAYCSKIQKIRLPQTLAYIGAGAFQSCYHLEELYVHPNNPFYFFENGCLIDRRTYEIIICIGKEKHLILPRCARSIGPCAYYGFATKGQTVTIGPNIKHISHNAFESLNNIWVTVPKTVKTIESNAFRITGRIFCEHKRRPKGWAQNWVHTTGDHSWQVFSEVLWADSWHYEDGMPVPNDNEPNLLFY